jgi:hypothetical protein
MELINKDTPQVKEFISSLDSMLNGIESIVKHYKPHLNGERFLSNNEVSKKLNVSLRTLQEWRDTGLRHLGEWPTWHRLCLRSRIAPLCIIRREIVDKKWEYTLSCFSEKLLLL